MTASFQSLLWHSELKTSNVMIPSQLLPWHSERKELKHDGIVAVADLAQRVEDLKQVGTFAVAAWHSKSKTSK